MRSIASAGPRPLPSTAVGGLLWFEVGATEQYYPPLHSLFWVEHRLWGQHPFGYHLLNLLMHVGAALGWFVLSLLCKTVTVTLPAALLVALWWRRGRLDARRDVNLGQALSGLPGRRADAGL